MSLHDKIQWASWEEEYWRVLALDASTVALASQYIAKIREARFARLYLENIYRHTVAEAVVAKLNQTEERSFAA